MQSKAPVFKETQLFNWESEPTDDRPSDFPASSSSAYAPISKTRQARPSTLLTGILGWCIALVVLGSSVMWALMHLLKA
jgi:hypothetical protein